MKTLAMIVVGVMLATPVSADLCEDWTRDDTLMSAAFIGAVAADLYTTDRILRGDGKEMNPVLGSNPNRETLLIAGASAAILEIGIACYLDQPWRDRWQSFWIGVEILAAYRNSLELGALSVGLRF